MLSVRADFEEKKREAEILFSLVLELSDTPRSIEKTAIVKSALILLLYNMIESTIVVVLEDVHEKLGRCSYRELSNIPRKLYVDFYFGKNQVKSNMEILNKTISEELKFPSFHDFSNRIRLFSGNLDVRSVNKILKTYGVDQVRTQNPSAILMVKNKRNKLAHGEEMMKDSCRGMTCDEVASTKHAVEEFLHSIINSFDLYLSLKKFRA